MGSGKTNEEAWNADRYLLAAYERVIPIILLVAAGRNRMSFINVFSQIPPEIRYPSEEIAQEVFSRLWVKIQAELAKVPEISGYNFVLSVEDHKSGGYIIRFLCSPDDVRRLSKD